MEARKPKDLKRGWQWDDFNNRRVTVPGENTEDSLARLIVELYSFSGSVGTAHHIRQTERRARWQSLSTFQREVRASAFSRETDEQFKEVVAELERRCPLSFVLARPERNRWCLTWQQYYEPMERLDDMKVKANPAERFPTYSASASSYVHCPVCKGYGGWILKANCYQPYDTTTEPPAGWTWDKWIEFYGPRQHFRSSCNQCNGWGWVETTSTDASCVHDYQELSQRQATALGVTHFGNCYHVYKCRKCQRIKSEDSSD